MGKKKREESVMEALETAQQKIKVARPDDFVITIIAPSSYQELRKELDPLLVTGKVKYRDCDQEPEVLDKVGLEEAPTEPIVIVSAPGATEGIACGISMVGASVIIHCEDKVIPLLPWTETDRAREQMKNPFKRI